MQNQLQITVRDMDHSPALDDHIRQGVAKLEQLYAPITSCRVVAEAPHKHHQQGRQFMVRLDISVPGKEIVVNHEHSEDIYAALRDAFDAAKRQLEEYSRKRRGETRGGGRRMPGREASSPD